jgi:hypothetical protein
MQTCDNLEDEAFERPEPGPVVIAGVSRLAVRMLILVRSQMRVEERRVECVPGIGRGIVPGRVEVRLWGSDEPDEQGEHGNARAEPAQHGSMVDGTSIDVKLNGSWE